MSYEEDRWDATRQSEEEPRVYPKRVLVFPSDLSLAHRILAEDFGDEWHCHDCGASGKTPWDPAEGCPRYPCHAFKQVECRACPHCGWVQ